MDLRQLLIASQSSILDLPHSDNDLKNYETLCSREPARFPHDDPPPSYIESQADTLPEYARIDPSIYSHAQFTHPLSPKQADAHIQELKFRLLDEKSILHSMTVPVIDFDDSSNFRQAAGKKQKKAQNAANKSKWADGGEGNEDGADGGEDGGGGGGGGGDGSNNGDGAAGGAGGDGGGGDDWGNDWNAPSKKKKGKKGKAVEEEEEEEKKKQEEEEQKKKDEENAANGGSLDWANEGGAKDDWGGFTSTAKKGKKNKKDKVRRCC